MVNKETKLFFFAIHFDEQAKIYLSTSWHEKKSQQNIVVSYKNHFNVPNISWQKDK